VRSGAVQNSAVQRFRIGGDHAQASETIARARVVHAVSALRRRRLREERPDGGGRDPTGSPQNVAGVRRQGRDAASAPGSRKGAEIAPQQVPGGVGRDRPAPSTCEGRSITASRKVRFGLNVHVIKWVYRARPKRPRAAYLSS